MWAFARDIIDKYGGPFAQQIRPTLDSVMAPMRALRAPAREAYPFTTRDGVKLCLFRYRGGSRGPVVLVHGYATTEALFDLDSIDTNLVEYLCAQGYDTWILCWRANCR